MPAQPTARLRFRLPALLAGTGLAAIAAAPAAAQTGPAFSCQTGQVEQRGGPDMRPVPRILRYAVAPGTDQTPVGALRESRTASVVGGDAERGWLRIDVQFDAAFPRDCRLPLELALADNPGSPDDQIAMGRMAQVLDGFDIIAGRPQTMVHLQNALRFLGSGTDTASYRIPIGIVSGTRPVNHALKLVVARDHAGGVPFTVTANPLPAFRLVPPSAPLAAGATTLVRVEHPVTLLPEAADMPVTFRLSSATLGRWQTAPAANPVETRGSWNESFTPFRAEAALVPASAAQSASGTISASFAGRTESVPVTIAAAPAAAAPACDPVFAVAAVAGGLRLSVTNRGRGTCPVHLASPLALGKAVGQLSPAKARLVIPTGLKTATGPLSPLGASGPGSSVTFTLDKLALAQLRPGLRYEFDITAEGASASAAKQRAGLTLGAAEIAVITGKKGL